MAKKVNTVKKHAVTINMNDVNEAFKATINMFAEHVGEALDPRDSDATAGQNPVSFADNPYYNRDVFLVFGAATATFEKAAQGQRDWQKKLEVQRDDEIRRNGELAETTRIDARRIKSEALEAVFENMQTLMQMQFEVLADREWTGKEDFYDTREKLFSGTTSTTQKRIKPTAASLLASVA
tara:strand:- start:972 stop:1514 length:543 start_codon:yes stop_codon:yes gene_type:complete